MTPRRRARLGLAMLGALGAFGVACSLALPFDDLGNGVRSPDGSIDPTDAPNTSDGEGDGGIDPGEAGAFTVDAESLNPRAGFGVFGLRLTALPNDGGTGKALPIRAEPSDGGIRELGCDVTDGIEDFRSSPQWGMAVHYDAVDSQKALFLYPHQGVGSSTELVDFMLATEKTGCGLGNQPTVVFRGNGIVPTFSDDGKRIAVVVADDEGNAGRKLVTFDTAPIEADQHIATIRDLTPTPAERAILVVRPTWYRSVGGGTATAPDPGGKPSDLFVMWSEINKGESIVRAARDGKAVDPTSIIDELQSEQMRCKAGAGELRQVAYVKLGGRQRFAFVLQDPVTEGDAGGPKIAGFPHIHVVDKPNCSGTPFFGEDSATSSNDFAPSPDGNWLAHQSNFGLAVGGKRLRIWIGRPDGTRAVCSDPPDGAVDVGPMWISGGAQIAWARRPALTNYSTGDIWIADFANGICTGARKITTGSAQVGFYAPRASVDCAMSRSVDPSQRRMLIASLVVSMLAIVLRRCRRRRCSSSS